MAGSGSGPFISSACKRRSGIRAACAAFFHVPPLVKVFVALSQSPQKAEQGCGGGSVVPLLVGESVHMFLRRKRKVKCEGLEAARSSLMP